MTGRRKLLLLNSAASFIQQLVNLICGLIVPRLILTRFGSETNGLVSSIVQFLSYIALLEAGVGGVMRAALYKPLAERNYSKISGVYNAANSFFRKIAVVFSAYALALSLIYPVLTKSTFSYLFVFSLVLILSIATIVQYYFGITRQILVHADQRLYINTFMSIGTTVISTLVCYILIYCNSSIHVIKLSASLIYIIQPFLLGIYIKRHYKIDPKIKPDEQAVHQKWDGLGQQLAYFVHKNSDVIILTILSTLKNVSVYSVYKSVLNGVSGILTNVIGNTEVTFGDMLARREMKQFSKEFYRIDLLTKELSTILYTTCGVLNCQFVKIYVHGVHDANYINPLLAVFLVVSEWIYCMGLNYHNIIAAMGHYKQTLKYSVIEAVINVVLSILFVKLIGLAGVALATFVAMLYKSIVDVYYSYTRIVKIRISYTLKSTISNLISGLAAAAFILLLNFNITTLLLFFIYAAFTLIVVTVIVIAVNALCFFQETKGLLFVIKKQIANRLTH